MNARVHASVCVYVYVSYIQFNQINVSFGHFSIVMNTALRKAQDRELGLKYVKYTFLMHRAVAQDFCKTHQQHFDETVELLETRWERLFTRIQPDSRFIILKEHHLRFIGEQGQPYFFTRSDLVYEFVKRDDLKRYTFFTRRENLTELPDIIFKMINFRAYNPQEFCNRWLVLGAHIKGFRGRTVRVRDDPLLFNTDRKPLDVGGIPTDETLYYWVIVKKP